MSRRSINDLLYDKGIDDPSVHTVADEADYRIQCLESRIEELEKKHNDIRLILCQLATQLHCKDVCQICGAIGKESCDSGLHG